MISVDGLNLRKLPEVALLAPTKQRWRYAGERRRLFAAPERALIEFSQSLFSSLVFMDLELPEDWSAQ